MTYHTCPICEASFSGATLRGGQLPAHDYHRLRCEGSGATVVPAAAGRLRTRQTSATLMTRSDEEPTEP